MLIIVATRNYEKLNCNIKKWVQYLVGKGLAEPHISEVF